MSSTSFSPNASVVAVAAADINHTEPRAEQSNPVAAASGLLGRDKVVGKRDKSKPEAAMVYTNKKETSPYYNNNLNYHMKTQNYNKKYFNKKMPVVLSHTNIQKPG